MWRNPRPVRKTPGVVSWCAFAETTPGVLAGVVSSTLKMAGSTPPARARAFIQDELDSAALYDTLATAERDGRIADVYRKLADTERRHADHWIAKLRADGAAVPAHRLSWRTRVLAWMARRFGAGSVVSMRS